MAHAFAAIHRNLDALAQRGIQQQFAWLGLQEQGMAIEKIQSHLMHFGFPLSEVVEVQHRVDGIVQQQHVLAPDQPAVAMLRQPVAGAAVK